jgi:hypothetical protein
MNEIDQKRYVQKFGDYKTINRMNQGLLHYHKAYKVARTLRYREIERLKKDTSGKSRNPDYTIIDEVIDGIPTFAVLDYYILSPEYVARWKWLEARGYPTPKEDLEKWPALKDISFGGLEAKFFGLDII